MVAIKDKKRNGQSGKSSRWLTGGRNTIMKKEKNEENDPLGGRAETESEVKKGI